MIPLICNGHFTLAVHLNTGGTGESTYLVTGSPANVETVTANPGTITLKIARLKFTIATICNDDAVMIKKGNTGWRCEALRCYLVWGTGPGVKTALPKHGFEFKCDCRLGKRGK